MIIMLGIEIVAVINWSELRASSAPVPLAWEGRAGSRLAGRPTNARMPMGVVDRPREAPTRKPRRNRQTEATIILGRLVVISISCRRDPQSKMQIKRSAEQQTIHYRMRVLEAKLVKILSCLTSKFDRS